MSYSHRGYYRYEKAINCNLLYGKPITDMNACLDKSCVTIKNSSEYKSNVYYI